MKKPQRAYLGLAANGSDPPSEYAIYDLVQGRPGALPRVAALTVGRAALMLPGFWIAGVRKDLIKTTLAVSTTLTLGLIVWKSINPDGRG